MGNTKTTVTIKFKSKTNDDVKVKEKKDTDKSKELKLKSRFLANPHTDNNKPDTNQNQKIDLKINLKSRGIMYEQQK